jgi:hypothetical protein
MAFLDNSGDIILDAVLTETGRRRMAQGNFRIVKFGIGDDEIDYSLYDKNHASGSAYYDLEILQTPVFEAFTQVNAGINYGLLATTAVDLLYLPVLKINEKTAYGDNIAKTSGLYYVADTSGDNGTNRITNKLSDASIKYLEGTATGNSYILAETGLDSGFGTVPIGSTENRESYIVANNLNDTSFTVFVDNRFFSSVQGITSDSYVNNSGGSTGTDLNYSVNLVAGTPTSLSLGIENYSGYKVNGISNLIAYNTTNTDQDTSVIGGPRSAMTAIALVVKAGISAEYGLYGTESSTTRLSGQTVDYVDTMVYVQGNTSGAILTIPCTIIRLS